jgi:hypothetical protein
MKNLLIIFILMPLFLVSCNKEENAASIKPVDIYALDFNSIEGTSEVNLITVKLTTPSGEEIKDVAKLRPNANYRLVVKGAGADFYRIKSSDGFEVVENPSAAKSASDDFVFTIKTTKEAGELYVNMVPLHVNGGKISRERPQVFLLPE